MAVCTLDLSHPFFAASLANPEVQAALNTFKDKVEKDHASCGRSVQKLFGNKKFQHLHNKIWKYDWSAPGVASTGRKSWRLIVVVENPDTQPYKLVAGAIFAKSVTEYLSLQEYARIFAGITSNTTNVVPEIEVGDFRVVSNGDGQFRLICCDCHWFEVSADDHLLDEAQAAHKCPPKDE